MSRINYHLDIEDINETLNKLVENINIEMDSSVLEGKLDDQTIRRMATERITIKRIKNILGNLLNKEE